jgi:hypothetical protein
MMESFCESWVEGLGNLQKESPARSCNMPSESESVPAPRPSWQGKRAGTLFVRMACIDYGCSNRGKQEMAVQACTNCDHYYILGDGPHTDARCPRCGEPLEPITPEQLHAHVRKHADRQRVPHRYGDTATPTLAPVAADPPSAPTATQMTTVRWVEASAESRLLLDHVQSLRMKMQSQRDEIASRLVEARLLRGELNQLVRELHSAVGSQISHRQETLTS